MGDLSKNIDTSEFFSKDIYSKIKSGNRLPAWYIDQRLISILQDIRDYFNKEIKITSGFRTLAENFNAGSETEWSMHLFGKAADFIIKDVKNSEVQDYIRNKYIVGLGCASNFTHIDTRNTKQLIEWRY